MACSRRIKDCWDVLDTLLDELKSIAKKFRIIAYIEVIRQREKKSFVCDIDPPVSLYNLLGGYRK